MGIFLDTGLCCILTCINRSLERINQYLHIEQEPKPTIAGRGAAYWPSSGDIQVEHLSARYSEASSYLLQSQQVTMTGIAEILLTAGRPRSSA